MTNHKRFCRTATFLILRLFFSSGTVYQVSYSFLGVLGLTKSFADISAARHADLLFVKVKGDGENDLSSYCNREGIKHVLFEDFSRALPVVQSIVAGNKTATEVLGG